MRFEIFKFYSIIIFSLLLLYASPSVTAITEESDLVIEIKDSQTGKVFEGIGALSAGASSRLLIEYPEPYRSRVLDYLFKPNFGAGFHHLKVEIGGDVNSTCGCEPSHAHTRDEFNKTLPGYFNRGYEWWLMKEAKKRNENIFLDCLEWGAPAWIGNGRFFSQDNADYIAGFINGAKQYHNLIFDYTGIWNETPYDAEWIKTLRKTLDRNNLNNVKIIAADQASEKWKIVGNMKNDAALHDAVFAVGEHYPAYQSPETARNCGKPIWSSEDRPWRGDWYGACKLAKIYNRNYIEGKMTKTVIWSLITSYYDILPLPGSGVMKANEPWLGHFEVQPALWITAHTTQFAQPGWKYIDSGCGYLKKFGSYVTLKSPDRSGNFSIIIETMDAPYLASMARQRVHFKLSEDLSEGPIYVWRSNIDNQFIKIDTIRTKDRTFSITVDGDCVYSLTTMAGQEKGTLDCPPSSHFPYPYKDDFEGYAADETPKYFSDQSGIFEVKNRTDGNGKCLRQVVSQKGIEWHYHKNPFPESIIGDEKWSNYEISADLNIEKSGFVSIFGRITKVPQNENPPESYWLKVDEQGNWELKAEKEIISAGTASFSADRWHTLKLRFEGYVIQGFIDQIKIVELKDTRFSRGMAGIGSGWNHVQIDNFIITPVK